MKNLLSAMGVRVALTAGLYYALFEGVAWCRNLAAFWLGFQVLVYMGNCLAILLPEHQRTKLAYSKAEIWLVCGYDFALSAFMEATGRWWWLALTFSLFVIRGLAITISQPLSPAAQTRRD